MAYIPRLKEEYKNRVISALKEEFGYTNVMQVPKLEKIVLKYDKDTKESVIKDIQRISKPGLRKYSGSSNIPRILNGLGIAIVSTSKGLMTGKQAKQLNVGGEVICYVY